MSYLRCLLDGLDIVCHLGISGAETWSMVVAELFVSFRTRIGRDKWAHKSTSFRNWLKLALKIGSGLMELLVPKSMLLQKRKADTNLVITYLILSFTFSHTLPGPVHSPFLCAFPSCAFFLLWSKPKRLHQKPVMKRFSLQDCQLSKPFLFCVKHPALVVLI